VLQIDSYRFWSEPDTLPWRSAPDPCEGRWAARRLGGGRVSTHRHASSSRKVPGYRILNGILLFQMAPLLITKIDALLLAGISSGQRMLNTCPVLSYLSFALCAFDLIVEAGFGVDLQRASHFPHVSSFLVWLAG
jgi:hypothetical protein